MVCIKSVVREWRCVSDCKEFCCGRGRREETVSRRGRRSLMNSSDGGSVRGEKRG